MFFKSCAVPNNTPGTNSHKEVVSDEITEVAQVNPMSYTVTSFKAEIPMGIEIAKRVIVIHLDSNTWLTFTKLFLFLMFLLN